MSGCAEKHIQQHSTKLLAASEDGNVVDIHHPADTHRSVMPDNGLQNLHCQPLGRAAEWHRFSCLSATHFLPSFHGRLTTPCYDFFLHSIEAFRGDRVTVTRCERFPRVLHATAHDCTRAFTSPRALPTGEIFRGFSIFARRVMLCFGEIDRLVPRIPTLVSLAMTTHCPRLSTAVPS